MTVRIGHVWEDAWAFARAEAALWLPVALAFWGLPALIPAGRAPSAADLGTGNLDPRFYLGVLVGGLVALFGQLAISALVLSPGETVGDALRTAVRRYPAALGAALIAGGLAIVYLLLISVVAAVLGIARMGAAGEVTASPAQLSAILVLLLPLLYGAMRLGTLWPVVVRERLAGWPALVAAFRETQTIVWRLALLWLFFMLALGVVLGAVNSGLGTLARVLGLVAGLQAPADAVVLVIAAGIGAAANGFWALFIAHLHRRLRMGAGSAFAD